MGIIFDDLEVEEERPDYGRWPYLCMCIVTGGIAGIVGCVSPSFVFLFPWCDMDTARLVSVLYCFKRYLISALAISDTLLASLDTLN